MADAGTGSDADRGADRNTRRSLTAKLDELRKQKYRTQQEILEEQERTGEILLHIQLLQCIRAVGDALHSVGLPEWPQALAKADKLVAKLAYTLRAGGSSRGRDGQGRRSCPRRAEARDKRPRDDGGGHSSGKEEEREVSPLPDGAMEWDAAGAAEAEAAEAEAAVEAALEGCWPAECPSGVGATAGSFLESVLSEPGRQEELDQAALVAWLRQRVREAALYKCQERHDAHVQDQLARVVHSLALRLVRVAALRPAVYFRIVMLDLQSPGAPSEAPQAVWDKIAKHAALTKKQSVCLALLHRWLSLQCDKARRRRQEAAAAASSAAALALGEGSYEASSNVADGLERANFIYQQSEVVVQVLLHTAVLTTRQLADAYVGAWPHVPLVPALLEAHEALCRKRGARHS